MSAPMEQAQFPIKTKQFALVINGISTDIVCRNFEDRLFIVITQFQKLGTLVHVNKDQVVEEEIQATYTTKVLLGVDEPLIHVIARNIATAIPTIKPILLGLALKDSSRSSTKAIEAAILENNVWD